MDGTPAAPIGTRIRYWRRRRGGMSQTVLAGLAGLSQSYISQIEAGRRGIERRSTLVAIAGALQVSVADLLGQPGDPTDPLKAGAGAAVPGIRVALVEIEEGERRAPTRGPEEMSAAVAKVAGMRARSEYAIMAPLLPDLLLDAAAYGGLTQAKIGHETSACLRNLGYRDLALSAARVAVAGAVEAGHPAWIGATRFVYALALPIESAPTTSRVADRALAALQDSASDPDARQTLGQLHLVASLACAVDQRPDVAAAHLAEAAKEAETLGDPEDGVGFNLMGFGPTNIGLWRMAVEVELGNHGLVIEIAQMVEPRRLKIANRHQCYWLDLGRALAHSGKTDREALNAFVNAERAAPVPFSLNTMARDSVVAMVHRARHRSVSQDLRMIAHRFGVDVAV
jgi:transcriptional regulator with XRE-family HTH domain